MLRGAGLTALALACSLSLPPATAAPRGGDTTAARRARVALRIRPSVVLDHVRRKMKQSPGISARGLAGYANALLARVGFNYNFDACAVVHTAGPPEVTAGVPDGSVVYSYTFTGARGDRVAAHLIGLDTRGMCAECFFPIPALRVTKREMLVLAGGREHRLRRPASFALDEAHLVDATMRRVLRTWQLPYQTVPAGISGDGASLYVDFDDDGGELEGLVLQLSDDGRVRFRARSDVIKNKGERVGDHPRDPDDAYLSFVRFGVAGKSYVVRFTGPCT